VLGINKDEPLDREGTDPVKQTDRGKVNWVSLHASDAEWMDFQTWVVDMCQDLQDKSDRKAGVSLEGLEVASRQQVMGKKIVNCPWLHLKEWMVSKGYAWPYPTLAGLQGKVNEYFNEPQVEDPSQLNYEVWREYVFFAPSSDPNGGVDFRFMTINVWLNAQTDILFEDGLDLTDRWQSWEDKWRSRAPGFVQPGFFFTDHGGFHWFVSQETINKEAYSGIALSLFLAYCVLLCATANWIVATFAICSIASIVTSVIAFSFWCGWKLGMLEAIIFVMVIGMSVDYVVHMADAYLESRKEDRESRAKFMVGKMAMSVLSGAVTTLGSSFVMVFAHITFFKKFGLIILWTIFQSLLTALLFFTAMMAAIGPQGTFGTIPFKPCFEKIKGLFGKAGEKKEGKNAPEEEKKDQAPESAGGAGSD